MGLLSERFCSMNKVQQRVLCRYPGGGNRKWNLTLTPLASGISGCFITARRPRRSVFSKNGGNYLLIINRLLDFWTPTAHTTCSMFWLNRYYDILRSLKPVITLWQSKATISDAQSFITTTQMVLWNVRCWSGGISTNCFLPNAYYNDFWWP